MSEQVLHLEFICDEQHNLGLIERTISAEDARARGYADLEAPRRIYDVFVESDDCETFLYLAIKERSTPLPAPLYFAREVATCALADYLLATRLGAEGTPKVLIDGILDQLPPTCSSCGSAWECASAR